MPLTGKFGLTIGSIADRVRQKLPDVAVAFDEIQIQVNKLFRLFDRAFTSPVLIGSEDTSPSHPDEAIDLILGSTNSSIRGNLTLCASRTGTPETVGVLDFSNYYISTPDKRIAFMAGVTDGSIDSGAIYFYTWAAGVAAERVRITSTGVRINGVPVYANNAAAVGGGLAVGDLYRTGADPDPVCIVH